MPEAPAAFQRQIVNLSTRAKALPNRITTPGTPPSRTIRFDPAERHHRHRRRQLLQKCAKIGHILGLKQPFGPPAALEPHQGQRRIRRQRPQP
jgi:hypothetical protein